MTLVGDFMRDDQVGLGVDGSLDILADHSAVPGAGGHGAGIGIGQRYLPIRRIGQGPTHGLQTWPPTGLGQALYKEAWRATRELCGTPQGSLAARHKAACSNQPPDPLTPVWPMGICVSVRIT